MAAFFAAAAVCFTGCKDDGGTDDPMPTVPTIALEGANIDQPQEMTADMSVKVNIAAEGKIQDLSISIDSPFLTDEMLAAAGLTKELNLANPASSAISAALESLGLPVGAGVVDKTVLSIDISSFIPIILTAYDQTADHKFTVKVTDQRGQSVTKTLTLHQTEGDKAAPTIVLVDGDIDQTQEITAEMSVKVSVTAPGAIAGFTVDIDSPALTPEMLASVDLASQLDLVNPGSMADGLSTLGFPVGDAVLGKTALEFDISALVPMIALIYTETSDHNFTLTVTDKKEQQTVKTLKFHLTGAPTVTYNNDADLWANTATVSVGNMPEGATVQYRVKDATDWIDATLVEGATYRFEPVWTASKNDVKLDIYGIEAGSGIFAASAYEYRIAKDGEALANGEFTTAAGDTIENGDMSGWSKKDMDTFGEIRPVTYPNAEGKSFWDSGNNGFLEYDPGDGLDPVSTPLCFGENGAACLMPRMVAGFIFAPGNMFTGTFIYTGMSGTANFGQPYVWNARPRALKVRYKAKVGVIDQAGSNDPEADAYKGQPDKSCIFVAVVDWTAQHGVTSGMVVPSGMWNPANAASFTEGPVLGYGQKIITDNQDEMTELILPISWYDKTAANPKASNFSLVISCATSMRGDYLTGCSTNLMYVDDFEWVY